MHPLARFSPARHRSALLLAGALLTPALSAQGTYQHVAVDPLGPQDMHVKAAGDVNGDGFQDLVVAGRGGELHWYEERSAHPAWTRHVVTSGGLGGWSTDAEVADLDGDGDQDILISDWYQQNRIVWFENTNGLGGAWTFHAIGAPRAHDIEVGDFDGDGDLDVVTRQQGANGEKLEFWRNDAGATQWVKASYTPPTAVEGEGLHVADIDADGYPDVVMAQAWYRNEGGAFPAGDWSEYAYPAVPVDPETLPTAADIDGDGDLDIVTTPSEFAGDTGATRWFEAPSDPTLTPWTAHVIDPVVETVTHSLGVADMDLDGDLDVVTAEMHQGGDPDQIRIYTNDGGAGLAWSKVVIGTGGSHSIRVLDIGGDGDYDVFGANWTASREVDLWENTLCAPRVGRPFCYDGASCPCGNAGVQGAGCRNSTGRGATLRSEGTASVSADDLVLVTRSLPSLKSGLFLMGDAGAPVTVHDGARCLSGQVFRFPVGKVDKHGRLILSGIVAHANGSFPPPGHVLPGSTWSFQTWCRDPQGPCGQGSNWSAALEVTFTP